MNTKKTRAFINSANAIDQSSNLFAACPKKASFQ